jgi:hypothetical protein
LDFLAANCFRESARVRFRAAKFIDMSLQATLVLQALAADEEKEKAKQQAAPPLHSVSSGAAEPVTATMTRRPTFSDVELLHLHDNSSDS